MEAELLEKALDTGAALGHPKIFDGLFPFAVVPDNYNVQSLDRFREWPDRIRQTVSVHDADSFVKYFTDYCGNDSRVFIDQKKPQILGVLDYHLTNEKGDDVEARWTTHRVEYAFRPTIEWTTWSGQNKRNMTQMEFAEFIEDNLPDIIHPDAATMVELSRTFEAKKSVNFSSAVRLQNHQVSFKYEEDIQGTAAKGSIEVPEQFEVSLAPFEGSDKYKVGARFRYKINPTGLSLRYELIRPHKIIEDAVRVLATTIQSGLSTPVTFGSINEAKEQGEAKSSPPRQPYSTVSER